MLLDSNFDIPATFSALSALPLLSVNPLLWADWLLTIDPLLCNQFAYTDCLLCRSCAANSPPLLSVDAMVTDEGQFLVVEKRCRGNLIPATSQIPPARRKSCHTSPEC